MKIPLIVRENKQNTSFGGLLIFPTMSHKRNKTVSSLNSSESRCSLHSSSVCRIRLSVHLASNMSYHVQRIWHLISSKFNFVSIVISINVINTTN